MDKPAFDDLIERLRLSFWLPTMMELLRLRQDREGSISRVDWIPEPPENGEKPRPTARQADYRRLYARPDDVLAYVISCLEPRQRRSAVCLLVRCVRTTDDPRRSMWMSALQTLAHHLATVKEPPDSTLVAVLGEELPKISPETNKKRRDTVGFEQRLSAVAVLILVSSLGLNPTRARESKRHPERGGETPNAAAGSACDVVAAGTKVSYSKVQAAWTQALDTGWLTKDDMGVVHFPDDRKVTACTNVLPRLFGRPEMIYLFPTRRRASDRDLLTPFHGDDATSELPKRAVIAAFRDYAPRKLFVLLTRASELASRRSVGSRVRDLITRWLPTPLP